jgi:hypothetical protein
MRAFAVRSLFLAALLAASIRAQIPCYAAYDGPAFDDVALVGGPWLAFQFVMPSSFTATGIEVFTGEAIGNNTVGLWTNDTVNSQPGSALGSGSWSVNPINSWQGATLTTSVAVTAGTTYWLVWSPLPNEQGPIDSAASGVGQVYKASLDGGQTWVGPFQSSYHHWKFRIFGDCVPTYCTAGTTSNGCAASISVNFNPSVTHTQACQVVITEVEGQKTGIIFYGLQPLAQAWCSQGGGSSYLCVKAPTQRTPPMNSGGAIGACNGQLTLDWNAFQLANPTALGAPWVVGASAYVQGWFRDPPACKTTSLSNGAVLTYQP